MQTPQPSHQATPERAAKAPMQRGKAKPWPFLVALPSSVAEGAVMAQARRIIATTTAHLPKS